MEKEVALSYRKIPSDLWLAEYRNWKGRYGLGDLLAMVSMDEYREGEPRSISFYADAFQVSRDVMRRLLGLRLAELLAATGEPQASHRQATVEPQASSTTARTYDKTSTGEPQASHSGATGEPHALRDKRQETRDKNKKPPKSPLTSFPVPLPGGYQDMLMLRIGLRHPDEGWMNHLGRLEQAIEALKAKDERSRDWFRRIWGYLNQVDIGEARRAHEKHPMAMLTLLKFFRKALAQREAAGLPPDGVPIGPSPEDKRGPVVIPLWAEKHNRRLKP